MPWKPVNLSFHWKFTTMSTNYTFKSTSTPPPCFPFQKCSKPCHWTRKVPKSPSPFRWIDGLKTFSCCKMGNASSQIERTKDGPCFLPTFPPPSKGIPVGVFGEGSGGGVVGISKKCCKKKLHAILLDDVLIYWCIYFRLFYIVIKKTYILRSLHITVYRTFERVGLGRVAVLLAILAHTGIYLLYNREQALSKPPVFVQ